MSLLIHIQHEDDLLAVIDRVLMATDDDVVIVVPSGARLFASEENLSLLKREAEASGKRVSIQTGDPRARALAARIGIPILAAAQNAPRRVFSDIVAPGEALPQQRPTPLPQAEPVAQPAPASEPQSKPEQKPKPPAESPKTPLETSPDKEEEVSVKITGEAAVLREAEAEGETEELPEYLEEVIHASASQEDSQGALPLAHIPEEPLPFLQGTPQPEKKRSGRKFSFPLSGKLGGRFGAATIVLLGVAVAFLVANEVLPSVEVRIQPKSDVITFTMPIVVAVGDVMGDVPGQRVQVSATEERTVAATGEADVNDRASGTITITNAFSSDSQTLVATTRFVSQDGKLFRLDKTIVVPGAAIVDGDIVPASIDATVTADEPGPEYNIGPSSFSIPGFQGSPKYNKFNAKSFEPIGGGARGVVKIVTQEDVNKAREGIEDALLQQLELDFLGQVVTDLIVAENARALTTVVELSAEADDVADIVVARAEGTLSAIAYRGDDLERVVLDVLRERIPADTDVVEGSTTITPTVVSVDNDAGTLTIDVVVQTQAAWRVDEQLVKDAIAGRDEAEIRTWLQTYDVVERARAVFRPFWVTSAPDNPDQIKVSVGLDAI